MEAYHEWRGWAEKAAGIFRGHRGGTKVHEDMGTLVLITASTVSNTSWPTKMPSCATMKPCEFSTRAKERALCIIHAENGEWCFIRQDGDRTYGPEGHPLPARGRR